MDLPTNLTQADHQRIQAIEARVTALEKGQGKVETEPALTSEEEAQLAALSTYLTPEQLAAARQKMLDSRVTPKSLTPEQQVQLAAVEPFLAPEEVASLRARMLAG